MLKRVFLSLFLISGILAGCKKDSPASATGVPNVSVSGISVNVDAGGYTNLLTVGGWVYVTGGYDGIILFCNAQDSYLAFDRGCPYDCITNSKAIVNVQTGGITAVCPVCGTVYSLYSGARLSGPGTIALKQYTVNYSNYPPFIYLSN